MRIKLVKSKDGYLVLWKRFFNWYYTDYRCTTSYPKFTLDRTNFKHTPEFAIANALLYFENSRDIKYGTIATFKSIQELKEYENTNI